MGLALAVDALVGLRAHPEPGIDGTAVRHGQPQPQQQPRRLRIVLEPHGLAVDSRGDVYVGEVSATAWPQLKPDTPVPSPLHSLRKMRRLAPS